jgi:Skp family chaperone for outer membrane proteins
MFSQIGFAREKIGVVDVQQLVNNSCEVKALKADRANQLSGLDKIVKDAQNAIACENDPQKIILLQDRYTNDFNIKKESIDRQYSVRLSEIENKLKNKIEECAKRNNYDYVFSKNVVFYGGDDITSLVQNDIR